MSLSSATFPSTLALSGEEAFLFSSESHEDFFPRADEGGQLLHSHNEPLLCSMCFVGSIHPQNFATQPTCSKRCQWLATGRCPQCGRLKNPHHCTHLFCSPRCQVHAQQANWCAFCAVRQVPHGQQTCMHDQCARLAAPFNQQLSATTERNHFKSCGSFTPHEVLFQGDKVRHMIVKLLEPAVGVVCGVVKIGGDVAAKKQYLAYRSQVEAIMSATVGHGAPKYGYGGEGNEQRRFVPINLVCSSLLAYVKQGRIVPCDSAAGCDACRVLRHGMKISMTPHSSHYCNTIPSMAAEWCGGLPYDGRQLCAMIVARAVIGSPTIVSCTDSVTAPTCTSIHSTVVSDGCLERDGTYLFSDDAILPQFLVLFFKKKE